MGIDIKVNAFEGPLDLLLHLIEKNKVDIYDIPISEITSQYLDYIRSMEEEDLDVMSDFLVMKDQGEDVASSEGRRGRRRRSERRTCKKTD
jgi:hypothetical protein